MPCRRDWTRFDGPPRCATVWRAPFIDAPVIVAILGNVPGAEELEKRLRRRADPSSFHPW